MKNEMDDRKLCLDLACSTPYVLLKLSVHGESALPETGASWDDQPVVCGTAKFLRFG